MMIVVTTNFKILPKQQVKIMLKMAMVMSTSDLFSGGSDKGNQTAKNQVILHFMQYQSYDHAL